MSWISRIRRHAHVGAFALTVLMLLGVLFGGFHHHAASVADDGCAVCTLAHASADAPPIVVIPIASVLPVEREFVAVVLAPTTESGSTSTSRGPPQG